MVRRSLIRSGSANIGEFPTIESRRASVLQDLPLFGRDFVLIPNPTYGGWLSAFEANGLGSSDELASTGNQVRRGLHETAIGIRLRPIKRLPKQKGQKFSAGPTLRIWAGPSRPSPRRKALK